MMLPQLCFLVIWWQDVHFLSSESLRTSDRSEDSVSVTWHVSFVPSVTWHIRQLGLFDSWTEVVEWMR